MSTDHRDLALEDAATEALTLELHLVEALQEAVAYREALSVCLGYLAEDRLALSRSRQRIRQLMGGEDLTPENET